MTTEHIDQFVQVGYWTPQGGLAIPDRDRIAFSGGAPAVADFVSALSGKHIRIVTILEKPFVMMKSDKYDSNNLSVEHDVEGESSRRVRQVSAGAIQD